MKTENTNEEIAAYSASKTSQMSHHQTTNFVDGDRPWEYEITANSDETTTLAGFKDAQLGDFLSRPIKIQEFQWAPGGTRLFQVFNPWTDFFGNSDVKEKINRYRNLRCNLRMKVLVNGNSFYYGRALLSYNPYLTNDDVTFNRAFFIQDLTQASQKPHLLLDPTTSQGGEMLLPFIWPENYLDITNAGWEDEMGRVTIHDFDILRHANGGTDPITVTVFVWAENLTLAVPTTAAAQSGNTDRPLDDFGFPLPYEEQAGGKQKKKGPTKKVNNQSNNDEFKRDGLISKPASAIAKAADALSMIPMLSPYAKATSMVADKVGKVARIFGYSRPQVVEDTRNYVPRYAGNMANSDAAEPLVKLSLDSKNELTIDTRVMGLSGSDELAISNIAKRPSFWRQFDWPESATTDTLLTSMRVTPSYVQTLSAAPVNEIHPTALAFAAAPFDCWQGSIKFRFVVVASEYHRGRLRLVYSPNTLNAGPVPFNRTYSTIIDITEDRDFEYEVKWADIRAWAQTLDLNTAAAIPNHNDSSPIVCGTGNDNGSLSVYVVNELATPSTTAADVKIQVWVSAGDDFALAVPTTNGLRNLSPYQEQSEMAPDAMATSTDQSNAPTCSQEIASFAPGEGIPEDNQYLVYQGERIVSFRELLRRYQYHYSYFPGGDGITTNPRILEYDISDFPFYRGWDPNGPDLGVDSTLGNSPYTFSTMTLLNYLTPAFVGRRGGLRHKVVFSAVADDTNAARPIMRVSRHNVVGNANGVTSRNLTSTIQGALRAVLQSNLYPSLGGMHVTTTLQNPVLEYETPFYTVGQRFVPARRLDYYSGLTSAHEVTLDVAANVPLSDYRLDKFVSIAEDFTLGMFVGAPILYAYSDPTAA